MSQITFQWFTIQLILLDKGGATIGAGGGVNDPNDPSPLKGGRVWGSINTCSYDSISIDTWSVKIDKKLIIVIVS